MPLDTGHHMTSIQRLDTILRWIHGDLDSESVAPLLQDARRRLAQRRGQKPHDESLKLLRAFLPRVVEVDGGLAVASYFKLLAGNVATLGGVRSLAGCESVACALLNQQITAIERACQPQIQAIVAEHDLATPALLQQVGFERLTCVQHEWLEIDRATPFSTAESRATIQPRRVEWRTANCLAQVRVARLIENTFEGTLDCPAINGRRDSSQVLGGFLDGQRLRQTQSLWQVLLLEGAVVGCLLLQAHHESLMELVYMGLIPAARGQGLGRTLVERAIHLTRQQGSQALAVAVDEQNWPARNVYRDYGFQCQQRFEVWMLPLQKQLDA